MNRFDISLIVIALLSFIVLDLREYSSWVEDRLIKCHERGLK